MCICPCFYRKITSFRPPIYLTQAENVMGPVSQKWAERYWGFCYSIDLWLREISVALFGFSMLKLISFPHSMRISSLRRGGIGKQVPVFLFKHNPQYPFWELPKRTVVFKRKVSVKTYYVTKGTFKKSFGLLAGPHSKQRSQSILFFKISKVFLKQLVIINKIRESRWHGHADTNSSSSIC